MIDTHTHLNFKAFADDWQQVVEQALANGIEKMIVVGTDLATSKKAVEMAQEHPALYASVGVHPHHVKAALEMPDARFWMTEMHDQLCELTKNPKVVAIGEIGLDYHEYRNTKYKILNSEDEIETLKRLQRMLLIEQVKLAQELNKPLILHSWEVGDEVLEILANSDEILSSSLSRKAGLQDDKVRGVFHCFDGSKKYVKKIIEAGFYVSFTGNVTFIPDRMDVATLVPLDRLLLETDCPYMTPEPLRGERNAPDNVKIVAQAHALARGLTLEIVDRQTSTNAKTLFDF